MIVGRRAVALLPLAFACLAVFSASASASRGMRADWQLSSSHVEQGAALPWRYSIAPFHPGERLLVQRQFGAARYWRTVQQVALADGSASGAAPGVSLGRYKYRAVLSERGQVLWRSGPEAVYSYGPVSIATLCRGSGVKIDSGPGCPSVGDTQIAGNVFSYAIHIESNDASVYPTFWNLIDFPTNTCRSLSLTFGIPLSGGSTGDSAYLQVVSQTLDPQTASVPYGALGELHAALDGRPWFLENSGTSRGDEITINGLASCYTATGT